MTSVSPSNWQNPCIRVFLVAGAIGTIGKAIVRQVAETEGSKVVLVCRDQQKVEMAVNEIIEMTGNPNVGYELADLSQYGQIRDLANHWTEPLHVFVNNPACTPRQAIVSPH